MHPSYEDITGRIDEKPSWWQEGGVPRWGEFTPQQASSIYAREVVLMEIACQSCETTFRVALCSTGHDGGERLSDQIVSGSLCYGDPPNTGCCSAGPTMSSIPRRILEYWSTHDPRYTSKGRVTDMERYFAWTRDPMLEGVYDGWMGGTRPAGASA